MANLIGKITSENGSFFIKHPDGTLTTAKVGDEIYEGDIIIGSASNTSANTINIALADNSSNILVAGANQQLFDVTMLTGEIPEDTIVQNSEVSESLLQESLNATADAPNVADEQATLTAAQIENLDAAAAGEETTTDAGIVVARLEDRTAAETDVTTDLRDATLSTTTVDETVGTSPILIDATLTLSDINIQEGVGTATILGSLDNTPLSTLVVTLSNGSTLTFGTDYTPGSLVASTPFEIQGDDVYIDPESYTVIGTSFVGGGFNSIVSNTSTVSVSDTVDTTTVNVTTADVNEDAATTTFNFQTSNPPQTGTTATLTVTLNGVEQTVNLDADGKGALVVDTKNPDVFVDSQSYEVIVTSINGGNFEATSVAGANATANVTNTTDAYRVVLSVDSSSYTEDDSVATYTVTLQGKDDQGNWVDATTNPYGADITVTMADGSTVTIGSTSVSQDFTVDVTDSDAIIDQDGATPEISQAISSVALDSTTITPESLTADTTAVTVDVTDTTDTTVLTINETLNSNGTYTYEAVVTNTPDTDLVVTLDNGVVLTISNGSTTADNSLNPSTVQANSVTSVAGGNYEDLDAIYGFGQNIIMVNNINNSINNIDMNTSYFDSDNISTELAIDSIILTPRVDVNGYAININGDKLTSTDNIGTANEETYFIKYDTTDPTNITAYRVNSTGVEYTSQIVFTITSSTVNEDYSISRGDYPLDGAGYTTENVFDSANSLGGGNKPVLLFEIGDLNVIATAEVTSGQNTVNFSNAAGSGELGIGNGPTITGGQKLYLNFTNDTIQNEFNSTYSHYDLNDDGLAEGNTEKISSFDANDVNIVRNEVEESTYAKPLTEAVFKLGRLDTGEIIKYEAFNNGVLVFSNTITVTNDIISNGGTIPSVTSSIDNNSIIISASDIASGWTVSGTTITYSGTNLSSTIDFQYSLDGISQSMTNFTLSQNQSINLNEFNEVTFETPNLINGDESSDVFSLLAMYAIESDDIPPQNQIINIDIETSDGTNTATGIMQVTFDGDGNIIGTNEDEVIDYTGTTSIDGGAGIDTLVLTDSDSIDFSTIPDNTIQSIEKIDLTDTGSQSVSNLTLADVMDMVPDSSGISGTNVSSTDHILKITGDSSDNVNLISSDFGSAPIAQETIDSVTYDIYSATNGTDTYKVLIQTDINDTVS